MRILQYTHVAEHVLHMSLFEETQPAPDLKRNVATLELQLNIKRMPVAAVEHGNIIEASPLVEKM